MIFNTFPDNPELYNQDLCPIVATTIARYGKVEWRAAILTTEMHGHLGIYAIVGVKMGVRALEYLHADIGDVNIISLAGTAPPESCLNDGLQVSTGATLGHGLIQSLPTDNPLSEATFSTKEKSIRMRLREDVSQMIRDEIKGAVEKFGHSPDYWSYVRQLAVRYWHELDRHEIFEIIDE